MYPAPRAAPDIRPALDRARRPRRPRNFLDPGCRRAVLQLLPAGVAICGAIVGEGGMPEKSKDKDLPGTVQRSPAKARRTYRKAHDSALDSYGEGERAHRTALSALKHSFEKKGDHWEPKKQKGPSDPQAAKRGTAARKSKSKTYGGVDAVGNSKQELDERARKLGVKGRSHMTKAQLAEAIGKKQ
jgi:cation transport regulator ChaB